MKGYSLLSLFCLSVLMQPAGAQSFATFSRTTTTTAPVRSVPTLPTISPVAPAPKVSAPFTPVTAPISTPVIAPISGVRTMPVAPISMPVSGMTPTLPGTINVGNLPISSGGTRVGPVMPGFPGTIGPTGPVTGGGRPAPGSGINPVGGGNTGTVFPGFPVSGGTGGGSRGPVVDHIPVGGIGPVMGDLGGGNGNGNGNGPLGNPSNPVTGCIPVGQCVNNMVNGCWGNGARSSSHGLLGYCLSDTGFSCPSMSLVNPNMASTVNSATTQSTGALLNVSQQESHLVLFSSGNQVLHGGKGRAVAGAPGTVLTQRKDMIILHSGRVTVSSGLEPACVQTASGSVQMQPEALAIIDQQPGKPLRVLAVVGGAKESIAVRNADRSIPLTPGEELIVAESGIDAEDLIPADGLDRVLVPGGIEKHPTIAKTKFSVADVLPARKQRAGKYTHITHSTPAPITSKEAPKAPVSNGWEVSSAVLNDDDDAKPMQFVAQPGTRILQTQEGKLNLIFGSVLLPAQAADATVDTILSRIKIKKNGIAMIESVGNVCRVKAMSGPGDVSVISDNKVIDLAPGEEVMVSDHKPSASEVVPQDAIARRVKTSQSLRETEDGNLTLNVNDFSMISMLRYPGYLQIIKKTDKDGKMVDRLIKTAAVVEMVTRGRGVYAYGAEPAQTQVASGTQSEKAQ